MTQLQPPDRPGAGPPADLPVDAHGRHPHQPHLGASHPVDRRPRALRRLALILGPVAGLGVAAALTAAGLPAPAAICGGITTFCALWWVTEPISVPATSIVTLTLLAVTGILTAQQLTAPVGHPMVILMMGGFMLSRAMEASGAHRLVAARMIDLAGGSSDRRLVLGFMLASGVLSMWISNTATTLMLLPAAMAVVDRSSDKRIALPLLLGIAYAASIGGVGTPIGTPPNVQFMGVHEAQTGQAISFLQWAKVGIPIVIILLPLTWLWLTRSLHGRQATAFHIEPKRNSAQKRVLIVFGCTALAWMTRTEPLGGWAGLLGWAGLPMRFDDYTVALVAVAVLLILPDGRGRQLLTWRQAAKIPWGVLLLFGAGIALARAFESTGLSQVIAQTMEGLATWPILLVIFGICLSVTLLTEVTSNTATATLLMPLLAAAAIAADLPPALLMAPAALGASCAFMLPVATPPNAVVFGSGHITIAQMARQGIAINMLGTVVITLVCWLLLWRWPQI